MEEVRWKYEFKEKRHDIEFPVAKGELVHIIFKKMDDDRF